MDETEEESKKFHQFGLDIRLIRAIEELGWKSPTLIQEKAIPLALQGKDILARARTGSGKTASFAVPIIQKILQAKQSTGKQCIRAIILAPTKDLATQICKHMNALCAFCSKDVVCLDLVKQEHDTVQTIILSENPDILVSVPGRLLHHLKQGHLSLKETLEYFVIDEADLTLSFGYEDDLKQIISYLPVAYQAFLVSASMTDEVLALKKLVLHNAVILKLEESQLPPKSQLVQYLIRSERDDKFTIIYALFKLRLIRGKTIVFANTIDRCYKLKLFLDQFGIPSCVLNSELPVNSRCHIIDQFNSGLYEVIIASDQSSVETSSSKRSKSAAGKTTKRRIHEDDAVVSRGIDFNQVSNVINFDFPRTVEDYVHRVGRVFEWMISQLRTARAWNQGNALSFASSNELKLVENVRQVLLEQNREDVLKPYRLNMDELDGFAYRAGDALRSVTSIAIKDARVREIKDEILRSKKLKMLPVVQYVNFNEDQDCFICGLDRGLKIYNAEPLTEKLYLDVRTMGSVKLCAMLHRTNIVAVVGGGPLAKFSENSVLIWDDAKKTFVVELCMPSEVVNVKMSYHKIVIVLKKQIHVFSFPGKPEKIASFETVENPHGLCELSPDSQMEFLAFPGPKLGSVQLTNLKQLSRSSSASPFCINAHRSEIACMAINLQGTLLATASSKGTLIRVFSIVKRTKLIEFRRGSDPANIYCINFNQESSFLCTSSDKGTVHVFAIKDPSLNRRSTYCNCTLLIFMIIVSLDGAFHKLTFTLEGSCNRQCFERYLGVSDDAEFWKS
ncbi:unnamed protein product [Soboliphyme baturini]|uniref:RNA helicase n=1 Tax=Soboliphyme baturini TaxID=241478 RepID=A0A183IBD5_9BILA|nr:unnamed protein product [Soboliphyme baturini]